MEQTARKASCRLWIGMLCIILCIAFDQFTKYLAVLYLKNKISVSLISGVFELTYLENHGAAFGILQGQKIFLILITAVTMSVLIYVYIRLPKERHYNYMRLTLVLFISGAIGNLIDRCMHDYVIDFFYFSLINFPVFNVADIYVTAAAALFIFLFCFYYKEKDVDIILELFSFRKKKEKH